MMNTKRWCVLALILAGLASPAVAQDTQAATCEISDTLRDCWSTILPDAPRTAVAQPASTTGRADQELALMKSETGIETLGANLATNTKDFLSLLNVTGLIGTTTDGGDKDSGTWVVDLNSLLPASIQQLNGKLQMVLNSEPVLYEPIRGLLPEDGRDERVEALENELSESDDLLLSFSVNVETSHFGRSFENHSDVYEGLYAAVSDPISEAHSPTELLSFLHSDCLPPPDVADDSTSPDTRSFEEVFDDEPTDATPTGCQEANPDTCTFLELANGDKALAVSCRDQLVGAAIQELDMVAKLRAGVVANRLPLFSALVGNQPQLSVTAIRAFRDELVGPDELSIEVSYEHPLAPNVNRLRKSSKGAVGLAAYQTYMTAVRKGQLEDADRLSISLTYKDRESLPVLLPDDGIDQRLEGSHSLVGSLGWGRVLARDEKEAARTHVALIASYEDVSDDPERQSRFLATLTITQRFGSLSVPFGIVYSNKPEFLLQQDLDEEVSAHVGLKWSFDKLED